MSGFDERSRAAIPVTDIVYVRTGRPVRQPIPRGDVVGPIGLALRGEEPTDHLRMQSTVDPKRAGKA